MPYYTPLRYPGGKRRLVPAVMRLLDANRLMNVDYVEPYAGGAAVALALLFSEYASTVHINDLSRPVFAFWYCVLNHTDDLCSRVGHAKLTMREWRRQRAVYDRRGTADIADLGFATLYLNRTNRSGIINGGVIGGQQQNGAWGLDARFNSSDLVQRIRRIARYRSRVYLHQRDALDFALQVLPKLGRHTFSLFDPPYIDNGEDLYLDNYGVQDHRNLAEAIARIRQPWVVTYDYAAIRLGLYRRHRRMIYSLSYSAQTRGAGREVMFFSDRLRLPDEWRASDHRRALISADRSRHPVYATIRDGKSLRT